MPYGLFDYTPGSTIHTMSASPLMEVLCKNGTWDITSGFVAPCQFKGGEAVPRRTRVAPVRPNPQKCAPTMSSGGCNYRLV